MKRAARRTTRTPGQTARTVGLTGARTNDLAATIVTPVRKTRGPLDLFMNDEGGQTTVSVALALLLSLTLIFSAVSVGWVMSRSAEIQEVADAAALSGANTVAAFTTIAQVSDACVLSLGLIGVLTLGAGLITSAIPGLSGIGASIMEAGSKILSSRKTFAESAAEGLESLEAALPLLIAANSYAVVEANEQGDLAYIGCAVGYPTTSKSSYKTAHDVDGQELIEHTQEMQEASDEAKEAQDRVDAALLEGWLADCGDSPRCLRERASTLAGLSGASNPDYSSYETWTFGAALERARAYYALRLEIEAPTGTSIDEVANSCARTRFYTYALQQVQSGYYRENADGTVDLYLPSLPHNTDETRATSLYTEEVWPCTLNDGVLTLHATSSCPGATGSSAGTSSLQALEAGLVSECSVCQFNVVDMGRVASASTSIDNGFEYFWKRIVEASEDFEQASNDLAKAEEKMEEIGEEGSSAFQEALEALKLERPSLCPVGAYGCVAVVARAGGVELPSLLSGGWLAAGELSGGVAISGAVLAPDTATQENNVLARFFDGLNTESTSGGDLLDSLCEIWGKLLVSYGSAYETVTGATNKLFSGIDGLFGTSIASWLTKKLTEVVESLGFEPADMSLRKPVLTNTSNILSAAGYDATGQARALVQALPASGSASDIASALGAQLLGSVATERITIAELPIPGTSLSIPLSVSIGTLLGET